MWKIAALVFLSAVALLYGFPSFSKNIPNGKSVLNPCPDANGTKWLLVGHEYSTRALFHAAQRNTASQSNPKLLNSFGLHYQEYRNWEILCQMDSDGDGKTNGQELGDPNCEWKPAMKDSGVTEPTGHPGICETGNTCNTTATMDYICALQQ